MEENEILDAQVDNTSIDTENPATEEDTEEVTGTLEDTSEENAQPSNVIEEKESQESVKEEKLLNQKQVDKMIKSRVSRLEAENRKKNKEYEELVNTLKTGMGIDTQSPRELNQKLRAFYKEQGIDIPEHVQNSYSDDEEIILGNHYADELIETDDDNEINRIANEIYQIPAEKRTARQKAIFNKLGEYMTRKNAITQLQKEGIDTSIVDNDDFKKFASQFSVSTPIKEIVNIYNKVNQPEQKVEKKAPASMGSTKSISDDNKIKEYYTPDEVSKFTSKDLDNPELMRAVEKSMSKWKK